MRDRLETLRDAAFDALWKRAGATSGQATEAGVKIAGSRSYFLKGRGAELHQAVLRLAPRGETEAVGALPETWLAEARSEVAEIGQEKDRLTDAREPGARASGGPRRRRTPSRRR